MSLVTHPLELEMTNQHIAATYEQELNDLNRFNHAVIEATRAWIDDPELGDTVSAMMEELRLRTLIVNAAQAMAHEMEPVLAAVA